MATATKIAPLTVNATLDEDGGGKHWIKYDVPEKCGLTAVYVDRRVVGIEKDAKPPKKLTVTVKFG